MTTLFKPLKVGTMTLGHRVAMAPMTRFRCDDDWVPLPIVKDYYEQRASVPGTLLITEATIVSEAGVSRTNDPALFREAQIEGWRGITDAVHKKGSFIYCQIWHLGRAGWPKFHQVKGTKFQSPSAIPLQGTDVVPEEMLEEDILQVIRDFATTAKIAIAAGFDGVEIHGAHGYLIDQFNQDVSNKRTDAWGGSIEKRARFILEVTKAVVDAVGSDKVGVRLSPFSKFQDMGMADPFPQFEYIVRELKRFNPAYLHLVEARAFEDDNIPSTGESLDSFIRIWDNQSPVFLAGGYGAKPSLASKAVDETWKDYDVVIAFGRYFISNPDLVFRLKEGIEFSKYDRSLFYTFKEPRGYADYPFSEQFLAQAN